MFTVATWNPGGGLGVTEKRSALQQQRTLCKQNFIEKVLNDTFRADISVISHYSDDNREPIGLGYTSIECAGRTLCGVRNGNLKKVSDQNLLPPNYMRLEYESLADGAITILAIYAAETLVRAHKTLEDTLVNCHSWLSKPKTMIIGDLNVWRNLKSANGERSSRILNYIENKIGLVNAFHNDPGNLWHNKSVPNGLFDNLDLTTFENHYGQTYIDYIFLSKDLRVVPGSSKIVHVLTREQMNMAKAGREKSSGRSDHSAVVASITSTGE